jgi:hypothetical protein
MYELHILRLIQPEIYQENKIRDVKGLEIK